MSNLSARILEALKGDSAGIQSLASAIVKQDVNGIQSILSARGLELDQEQVASLLSQVASAQDNSASALAFTIT